MHWSKWRFSWIPRTGHIMRPKFTVAWKQNNSSNKTLRRSWRQAMVAGKEMVSAWTGQTSVKWMLVTVFAEFWNTEKALVESEEKTQTSSNKESQEEDSKIYQNTASWSLQEALKGVAGIPGNSVSRYEIIQSSSIVVFINCDYLDHRWIRVFPHHRAPHRSIRPPCITIKATGKDCTKNTQSLFFSKYSLR